VKVPLNSEVDLFVYIFISFNPHAKYNIQYTTYIIQLSTYNIQQSESVNRWGSR